MINKCWKFQENILIHIWVIGEFYNKEAICCNNFVIQRSFEGESSIYPIISWYCTSYFYRTMWPTIQQRSSRNGNSITYSIVCSQYGMFYSSMKNSLTDMMVGDILMNVHLIVPEQIDGTLGQWTPLLKIMLKVIFYATNLGL